MADAEARSDDPSEWNLASEHLAERYRQFIIIAVGETVITTGRTFHASEFSLHRGMAFTVAFGTSVLLYFTYFYRTREKLGTAFSHAHESGFRNRESAFAHLLMVAGIVAITVSDEMVIAHATAAAPASWLVIILSGPVLFLAGHALLGRHVFTRVSMPRLIGLGVLIAIGPPLVGQPVLVPAAAAAVVLAGSSGSTYCAVAGRWAINPCPAALNPPTPLSRKNGCRREIGLGGPDQLRSRAR
ncbi:low temperature requirement protein A [Micromonospora sp. M12]